MDFSPSANEQRMSNNRQPFNQCGPLDPCFDIAPLVAQLLPQCRCVLTCVFFLPLHQLSVNPQAGFLWLYLCWMTFFVWHV